MDEYTVVVSWSRFYELLHPPPPTPISHLPFVVGSNCPQAQTYFTTGQAFDPAPHCLKVYDTHAVINGNTKDFPWYC